MQQRRRNSSQQQLSTSNLQPFQHCQDCSVMDAITLVAAAVAVAIDQSRQAAMEQLLIDKKHAAMRAADAESRLAERVDKEVAELRDVWRAARHQAARVAVERARARQARERTSERPRDRSRSR